MNHAMLGRPPRPTRSRKPTAAMRAYVLARDNYTCRRCGATGAMTVDHIVPWAKGGKTAEPNLQSLCARCNGAKSASDPTAGDLAPPAYLHTTDPLCATCGASFRENGEQCASCAYSPCDSDC
jgi:hypothetical protein